MSGCCCCLQEFLRALSLCLSGLFPKVSDFLCSSGPEASRLRSALNPKMLKLQEVATFAPMVNVVVGDLLRRVEFLRRGSQDGVTVSDIASELYKFGFEGSS